MEETSIGHQEGPVGGGTQGAVVVGLVEQAGLVGGGLGGQGHHQKQTQGGQPGPEPGDEGGVGGAVLGEDVLEVHVQAPVALGLEIFHQSLHQAVLDGGVGEDQVGQVVGEAALIGEGGQVHQRAAAGLAGGGEEASILQLHQ